MYEQSAEMEMVVSRMKGRDISYLMTYSGGEVCPVSNDEGKPINRSHSNTFIICVF
jgi:hypothetical protein